MSDTTRPGCNLELTSGHRATVLAVMLTDRDTAVVRKPLHVESSKSLACRTAGCYLPDDAIRTQEIGALTGGRNFASSGCCDPICK